MEIETGGNYNTILQSVQKKSPPDLEIINHGVSYHCHFNIISIFSKKISSLTNRPTTIELKTKTKLHFLNDVIDFFYGHPIIFDFTNYKEISILASYFEIDNLKEITAQASKFFDFSNNLLHEVKMNDFSQKEIDFFAFYFQAFSNNEIFNRFPVETIQKVLTSNKMTIVNEDYLVHWILNKYKDVNSRKKLLSFVVFEKVGQNGFKEIFSSLENLDEINEKVQTEFIKDPRKRNLSLDRNPRYFEKTDDLTQRILNFDLSKVFSYKIPEKEEEEEDEKQMSTTSNFDEKREAQNQTSLGKNFSFSSFKLRPNQFINEPKKTINSQNSFQKSLFEKRLIQGEKKESEIKLSENKVKQTENDETELSLSSANSTDDEEIKSEKESDQT